ncbi:CHAT domain-containing protein [Algibacter marinivivus]|nr:CHAT domain-containing protein [Algibacter marinivivus]
MIKSSSILKHTFLMFVLLFVFKFQAQNDSISNISYIQKLIKNDSLEKASKELKTHLDFYRAQKNTDSLIKYVFLVGSLKLANNDYELAIKKAEAYGKELKQYNSPFVDKEALLEIAWIYDDAGYTERSYEIVEEALEVAKKIKDPKKAGINSIYHNLGYLSANLGNYSSAKKYYLKATTIMEGAKEDDYESLHQTYNALGGMMWQTSELDSSVFYFNKALKMLDKAEKTPMNMHYRKALVNLNLAVLNQSLGKIDQAIESSKEVIEGFQKYLDISDDESRKLRALKHQLAAIDNLGVFYHSVGEFEKADKLVTYAYNKKAQNLAPDDNDLTISPIICAQAKIGLRDFKAGKKLIDHALDRIDKSKNTQLFWHASALSTKASISNELGEIENADDNYNKAYIIFKKALGNTYNRDFLDVIINMSQFHASQNNASEAISYAEETYNFIKNSDFKSTIQEFHHIVNLSEVHYKLKNYDKAITYSNEAINFLYNIEIDTNSFKDSIQIQYRKPKAILINAKSKYALNTDKSEDFLIDLLNQTKNSLDILEQRKTIINSYEDLNLLITENSELFNFSKQLLLDLYYLTNNETYLNKLLSIHESSIYNRIRSRFNLKNSITFSGIPNTVIQREKILKNNLNTSINNINDGLKSFSQASSNWNSFLDSIKQVYPKYYKMRYATIEEPMDSLKHNIPKNTTVVRYLFIDTILYAMVIDSKEKHLFKLDSKNVEDYTFQLTNHQSNTNTKLHQLYLQLWKPFEKNVVTDNVIIIPDGPLFNLSFESLTPSKINSFKDLAKHSLLAKHTISYNYSLLLLGASKKSINYQKDFIAFAPEFNDKMKQDYSVAIKDSISIDETYLSLLPQPFSVDLAKEYSRLFDGDYFINENASKQIFKNEANEHKIIHIGTHAESNNISPELSRLIFAKNIKDEDNSLYTYEIYNENLNSNLAILTACETGKPTYQAGEGMISLAHAFNYAGSESILTSLWKIDEKSSTQIIELFYNNIKKGLSKDKALQQAKLNYISNNEGRIIAPNYWAGLVLIGDTSPINLKTSSTILWYLLCVLLLIIATVYIIKTRKK